MFQSSKASVTCYGRGLSFVAAFLSPFFAIENLKGEALKQTLKESLWMIGQALKGRQLFYLNWNSTLDMLIPYEVYDGGPILDANSKVSFNSQTVGEYKMFDEGSLIIAWWNPGKQLPLEITNQ